MALLLTFLAALWLAIWLYLFFARGNFWRLREDFPVPKSLERWPRVVVVVPARNEAETIAAALVALAKQDYPGEFSIVVADDQSEDCTVENARRAANECKAIGRRVTIIRAADRPAGWTGKLWALEESVRAARKEQPDLFWFTDADIVHAPDTLSRLVFRAENDGLSLTSLFVLLKAKTFAERLLIPAFLYFFLLLYPPRWTADPRKQTAGAAGGCILIRRSVLEQVGGLEAIRGEVIDDCALARVVKRSGERIWMGLTRRSVSLRSYETFAEIRDLIARTAFTQLRYSMLVLLGTLFGMFFAYFVPLFVLFSRDSSARMLGATAWALMSLSYLPTVRFYCLSPFWAPVLPIAAIFYSYATLLSAVRYWLGRGGHWKGRAQAPRAT